MKLVMAVVSNQAAEGIIDAMLAAGFRATRLASTGGFRREGNTTIMTGVDDDDVEAVLALLRSGVQTPASRKAAQQPAPDGSTGRGAAFVLPLEASFRL
jgi:uncharacterized protein YaaQ